MNEEKREISVDEAIETRFRGGSVQVDPDKGGKVTVEEGRPPEKGKEGKVIPFRK